MQDTLSLRARQLEIASEASGNFQTAIAAALRANEGWSGNYGGLNIAIEAQLAPRNALAAGLEAFYDGIKADLDQQHHENRHEMPI